MHLATVQKVSQLPTDRALQPPPGARGLNAHSHRQAGVTKDFLQGEDAPCLPHEVAGEGVAERVGGLALGQLDAGAIQGTTKVVAADGELAIALPGLRISCSSAGSIGTVRTRLDLVLLNVTAPFRILAGASPSASDQGAPMTKQIRVIGSTRESLGPHQLQLWAQFPKERQCGNKFRKRA